MQSILPSAHGIKPVDVASICCLWAHRMLDTASAVLVLHESDLGHTTQPLNRLVVELCANAIWLARAEDELLALKALEAERLRQQRGRFQSFVGEADGFEDELVEGIARTERDLKAVALVGSADEEVFRQYRAEARSFERLVDSLDTQMLYVAFRFISSDSHACLDIAVAEAKRWESVEGAGTLVPELRPSIIVLLAAVTMTEIADACQLSGPARDVLAGAGDWAESAWRQES